MTTTVQPLAVSISDAATLLNCSRPFVYKLIEQGQLTVVHLGHRASRIPLEQIHALLGIENEATSTV